MDESTPALPAGMFRRFAALFYDLLLVLALAFALSFAFLPLTQGEAILTSTHGMTGRLYHALLALIVFAYFGLGWTRGGQTLGMKAWRIRLQGAGGRPPRWADAIVRLMIGAALGWLALLGAWYLAEPGWTLSDFGAALLVAPALANFVWAACDASSRTFQDLAGGMCVTRA